MTASTELLTNVDNSGTVSVHSEYVVPLLFYIPHFNLNVCIVNKFMYRLILK